MMTRNKDIILKPVFEQLIRDSIFMMTSNKDVINSLSFIKD